MSTDGITRGEPGTGRTARGELFLTLGKAINDEVLPELLAAGRITEDERDAIQGVLAPGRTREDFDRLLEFVVRWALREAEGPESA